MEIKALSDKALFKTKREVLRLHLYYRLLHLGIKPFENDMDLMLELYLFGGYNNSTEQGEFIASCLKKRLKKSDQSVRNTISKYINLGVFIKPKNTVTHVSEDFLPKISCDKLVLQYTISHAE